MTGGGEKPNLPGFYYDEEKKRYFKIQPGHDGLQPGAITKEVIQNRQNESARARDLQMLQEKHGDPMKRQHFSGRNQCSASSNLYTQWFNNQQGTKTFTNFKKSVVRTVQSHLQPKGNTKIFAQPDHNYEYLEHMQQMYPSAKDESNLICLWSIRNVMVQRIQTVSVNSIKNNDDGFQMQVAPCGAMILKAFSKITAMCCAPVCGTGNNEYILYTTMCVLGNNPSMAMLRNLNCATSYDFRYTEFNLGNIATWCCAWAATANRFSIGTEKHSVLLDVETRRLWELGTKKDDVLAQAFSKDSRLLYSGTRTQGLLCAHDLRSVSTSWSFRFHNSERSRGYGVCSIRVSEDDRYIYTSDFNGKIKRWDTRQRKVVLEYMGHKNKYSVIPIHINEEDNLLYAAGQDCYTRLWDLKTAELLTGIPPPYPTSIDSIPSVSYTPGITSKGIGPSLFLGIKDELHFYNL